MQCDQSYWNGFSTGFESIVYFLAMVRCVNAWIVIRSNWSADRELTAYLHASSAVASIALAAAVTIGHRFISTLHYDGWLEAFLWLNFFGVFSYDLWLILRDRVVQCPFLQTPRSYVSVAATMILMYAAIVWASISQIRGFKYNTAGGFLLFIIYYTLQLLLVLWMTFVFTRPLLKEAKVTVSKETAFLRQIVLRTAIGCAIHFATSLVYIITLTLYVFASDKACLGTGNHYTASFSVSVLGLVAHLNLSHRDDVALKKIFLVVARALQRSQSAGEVHGRAKVPPSLPADSDSVARREDEERSLFHDRISLPAIFHSFVVALAEEEKKACDDIRSGSVVSEAELTSTFAMRNPSISDSSSVGGRPSEFDD